MFSKFSNNCNDKTQIQNQLVELRTESNYVIGAELAVKLHRSTFCLPKYKWKKTELQDPIDNQKNENLYRSKNCQHQISNKPNSKRRKIVQPVEFPCSWPECNRICFELTDLERHLRVHADGRMLECNYCNRTFKLKCNLQRHVRIHTGEKPYSCSICSRSFSQCGHLQGHLRTHTNERPFKCTFCSKTFAYQRVLQNHVRIHTGERPYSCSICSKSFKQRSALQRHMRTHNEDTNFGQQRFN